MTNEELLSVAEIVEKLTDRFNAQAALHRERHNEYDKLIASMNDDHEAKMVEHRAAFGALAEADAKIIAGLRSEIGAARMAVLERDSLMSERAKLQAMVKEQSDSAKAAGELLGWTANESPIQAVERVVRERDGLLTQVQDMRAEINRLTGHNADAALHDLLRREYDKALTLCETDEQTPAECIGSLNARIDRLQDDARSDARVREDLHRINVELQAEVASRRPKYKVGDKLESYSSAVTIVGVRTVYDCQIDGAEYPVGHSEDELKECYEQTPKQHPVKVGEWARRTTPHIDGTPAGSVQQVRAILPAGTESSTVVYEMQSGSIWAVDYCEPCDPPSHDTEAGKAAAESAVKTEPVTDEIKAGDVVEVFQATGKFTYDEDIGARGIVAMLIATDNTCQLRPVKEHKEAEYGWVNIIDVRKVTT